MGYKLIALDIDGTIGGIGSPIARRTRRAVAAAREAGAVVTLVTGRTFGSAARSGADLAIDAPISSAQGAYIANPISGKTLRHCPLSERMALTALDALEAQAVAADMLVVGYHAGGIYVNRADDWATAYGERNRMAVEVVGDLRAVAAAELTRIVVVGEGNEAGIAALEAGMRARVGADELCVTRSLPHFCEILHPDGGKDSALAFLCEHFGIARGEVAAFGNGYNDVPMLRWAGLGIAVGDAVPEALAAADRVAPNFADNGVARVLEELLADGLIG